MRHELEDPAIEPGEEPADPRMVPPAEPREQSQEASGPARLATAADRVAARRRLDRLAERWW